MIPALLLLATTTVAAPAAAPPPLNLASRLSDAKATFAVRVAGQPMGTESDTVHCAAAGCRVDSRLQYLVQGRQVVQKAALKIAANGDLERYQWREGDARIDVSYRQQRLIARYNAPKIAAREFDFELPAGTTILDDRVYIDWEVLAAHYRRRLGGTQSFRVFVPHSGDPGWVKLTAQPAAPGGLVHLHAVTSAGTAVELYLQGNRLVHLEIPTAALVVTRQ